MVESVADELLTKEEVKDYFDRLIYGTAADRGCALLTEGERFSKLKKRRGPTNLLHVLMAGLPQQGPLGNNAILGSYFADPLMSGATERVKRNTLIVWAPLEIS